MLMAPLSLLPRYPMWVVLSPVDNDAPAAVDDVVDVESMDDDIADELDGDAGAVGDVDIDPGRGCRWSCWKS